MFKTQVFHRKISNNTAILRETEKNTLHLIITSFLWYMALDQLASEKSLCSYKMRGVTVLGVQPSTSFDFTCRP